MSLAIPHPHADEPIQVKRWPSELPLFWVCLLVSLAIWVVIIAATFGLILIYAALVALIIFIVHVGFIAHVRGNGVRLGPNQFPELYAAVDRLARRMGMTRVPDTYIMQAGGSLNAFATRFLRSQFVILFSDLLEACGDNRAARDMIIAHELGHIRAGHLRWRWVLAPSFFIPFLGTALSRAREYTCDRIGRAGAGDQEGAILGLTILAAGAKHGPLVNREAMVRQRADLNTGLMTLAEWLSTHPPLAKRIAALDPPLAAQVPVNSSSGVLRAAAIMAIVLLPFVGAGYLAVTFLPMVFGGGRPSLSELETGQLGTGQLDTSQIDHTPPPPAVASAQLEKDFKRLADFLNGELRAGRTLPPDEEDLYTRWSAANPGAEAPTDPYDGQRYGYDVRGKDYIIWSSGPDQRSSTDDDIVYDSRSPSRRPQPAARP